MQSRINQGDFEMVEIILRAAADMGVGMAIGLALGAFILGMSSINIW